MSGKGGLGSRRRHAQRMRYRTSEARYRALEAGLARIAWDEYAFDLLGEYPPDDKPIAKTVENLEQIHIRTGLVRLSICNAIDHIEALRPGKTPKGDRLAEAAVRRGMPGKQYHRERLFRQLHPIRLYRVMKGWSMAETAKQSGCMPTVVQRWETGEHPPNMKILRRMADGLGIDYPCLAHDVALWSVLRDRFIAGNQTGLEEWLEHLRQIEE